MKAQVLDSMDLERERGITIKAQAVRLEYEAENGERYQLNLIDTPGHVDFSYEVSRSLASCEGALLVVDAAQGVEAQTLANTYLALDHGLEIIPVVNKIDLPAAEPERVCEEIESTIGLDASDALLVSAKSGQGVPEILEAVVRRIPPPRGAPDGPARALLFDSWYDTYRGVVMLVRMVDGSLHKGMTIRMWSTGQAFTVEEVGFRTPKAQVSPSLRCGEAGWVVANIKDVSETRVGDTICDDANPPSEPLPGFQESRPMVFAGLYSVESQCARGSARGAAEAAAQRPLVPVRAGKLRCARVRFPGRFSWAAASGNRARTAGAGVWSRSHHNGPGGPVSHPQDRRRNR